MLEGQDSGKDPFVDSVMMSRGNVINPYQLVKARVHAGTPDKESSGLSQLCKSRELPWDWIPYLEIRGISQNELRDFL